MQGKSGRIVIEIDPALKRQLYALLALEGLTLKDWFLDSLHRYVKFREQRTLFDDTKQFPDEHGQETP